jgi:hypothetical protein
LVRETRVLSHCSSRFGVALGGERLLARDAELLLVCAKFTDMAGAQMAEAAFAVPESGGLALLAALKLEKFADCAGYKSVFHGSVSPTIQSRTSFLSSPDRGNWALAHRTNTFS